MKFDDRQQFELVVSDLTYVRVGSSWSYICTIMDLHNREIVGYSCWQKKNAELVHKAFTNIHSNLGSIKYFHSDRGSEFDNYSIDDVLSTFGIKQSLSRKATLTTMP
ncbi:DDE-type integrase/transposase/recombinase [Erysipelothrix rhusiopathiae]|uniref:DDE-type integrase/transposase/recombinase n=1 Tax=Erysipelothrix rhusiopathiae TaxID=1648 RepID=UPI003CCB8867